MSAFSNRNHRAERPGSLSIRRTRGVQHGPRSVDVVARVQAATLAEIAHLGADSFTIDGVAKAAGVNRTTIYRRWPTKATLLAAAVEPLLRQFAAGPDTGSLRGDLLTLMFMFRRNSELPAGHALTAASRSSSTELRELVETMTACALAPLRQALSRAVERGELDADVDRDVIAHLIFYGVVMWDQSHATLPSDADCERLLGALLPGDLSSEASSR